MLTNKLLQTDSRKRRKRFLSWPVLIMIVMTALFWPGNPFSTANAQDETPAAHTEATEHSEAAHVPSEDHGGSGHEDPVTPILIEISIILIAAKLGGAAAEKLGQPSVLGELLVGVFIGSFSLWGVELPSALQNLIQSGRTQDSHLDILARLGVVLLLFEVGLESSVGEMVKIGWTALLVATVGVVAPFALGFGTSYVFVKSFPEGMNPTYVHLFIGATLCATSVGITARVFKDLNKLNTREAKVILGAAVFDDVMGLVILAVVTGIITAGATGGEPHILKDAAIISLKALAFLAGAIFVGLKIAPYGFRAMASLRGAGLLLATSLAFCFAMAYVASEVGLAPIVGAFAAGLVLEESHIESFLSSNSKVKHRNALEHQIHPVSALLVPIFFVQMGIQVELDTFVDPSVVGLAALLTISAIIGKQVCGLVIKGGWSSRLTVGFGMIPRGEVGLIFASIGLGLGVVSASTFSAIVIMVIVTTLITPPLLKLTTKNLKEDVNTGASSA